MTTTYNGWKNRQTWNINLWLMNDRITYRACVEEATRCKTTRVGCVTPSQAEALCRDIFGESTPDGCNLTRLVDWTAIAASISLCAE